MLPVAVSLDRRDLPSALVRSVHALNGAQPRAFTTTLISAWAVIGLAVIAAESVGTWWATATAILLVGTRMNVLGLLVHEQVHLLGYRNRYGDLLVNLFCAYPLVLLTVQDYAQVHLAHHQYYFTDRDPDHLRKSGPEWKFPKTRQQLLRIAVTDLLGLNLIKLFRGKRVERRLEHFVRRGVNPIWLRPMYFTAIIGFLVMTGTWKLALLYWVLPLLTVMQLIVRWGAICEHEYGRPQTTVAESTPLIELRWWEKMLLPNLNFSMHVYHHYFPGVAFNCLPAVHRLFVQAGLVNEHAVFAGYGAYFRYLTTPRNAS